MALVQETLTYSMPVPKIIDQLDLWEHVGGWMASICCGTFAPAEAHVDGMDVEVESGGLEGPCASDGLQQCTTACIVGSWIVFEFSMRNSCRRTASISENLMEKPLSRWGLP